MIGYPAMLDVPEELVTHLAGLLDAERVVRGTRTGARTLTCANQAVFALAWFREQRDVALLGAGFQISQATAYRYLDETIGVLAAQAPDLHEALQQAREALNRERGEALEEHRELERLRAELAKAVGCPAEPVT